MERRLILAARKEESDTQLSFGAFLLEFRLPLQTKFWHQEPSIHIVETLATVMKR